MQPDMAGRLDAEWHQHVLGMIVATAGTASPGRRALEGAVHPFDEAAFEGARLGFPARQAAIELRDAGALVEIDLPVLGRPSVPSRP